MKREEWNIVFYTSLVKLVVFLRFLFGPTIFFFPRLTSVISFLLDWMDGEIFKRAGYSHKQYSFYDKSLDYYWYIWILLYILLIDIPYKVLFISLFLFRTVGQILYFLTKKEIYLLIFFNAFEILFFYYLAVTFKTANIELLQPFAMEIALIIIIGIVLIREYILHFRKANLSNMFFGHPTMWSVLTYNKYKAFGFIVIIFAFLLLIPITSNSDLLNYITKAKLIPPVNKITYYSSQGDLAGYISKVYKGQKYRLEFYNNTKAPKILCEGDIPISANSAFIYHDNCLRGLENGIYILRLTSLSSNESITIEFNIIDSHIE